MSIASIRALGWKSLRGVESRHRLLLWLNAAAIVAVVVGVFAFGWSYYLSDSLARPHSPQHALLKPGGTIGVRLGMLGAALFFLAFLYPMRKHSRWLGKIGKTKHWLDFHILAGLTAPAIITLHSSFKMNGIAGVAYWIMMAAVLSGIVGRYFYAQIPRHLSAAEMSLKEIVDQSDQLTRQLTAQSILTPEDMAPILKIPDPDAVKDLSLAEAIYRMIAFDIKHSLQLRQLRRRVAARLRRRAVRDAAESKGGNGLDQVILTLRKQLALSKRIVFYSQAHRIFNLWHVIHRPFPYSFAVLAFVHIAVVVLLGYF